MAQTLYENRLVAMLDVLGFDATLQTSESITSVVNKYAKLIRESKTHAFTPSAMKGSPNPPPRNFEIGEFIFDTLVLVSKPLDVQSTKDFLFTVSLIIEKFFGECFPLRGAISLGNVCVESDPHLVISDRFKRLSEICAQQDWAGCIVLPEAQDTIVENIFGTFEPNRITQSSAAHKFLPPWKSAAAIGSEFSDLFCINWSYMMSRSQLESGLSFLRNNERKFNNTNAYLSWLWSLPDDRQLLPTQFLPAATLKVMKARAGCRVFFQDQFGEPVNPGCDYTLGFFEQ